MVYIIAITVLLSAIVSALMEKHFISLLVFGAMWGIITLIVYLSGNLDINSGMVITLGVGVVFMLVELIRRKFHMVNLKM